MLGFIYIQTKFDLNPFGRYVDEWNQQYKNFRNYNISGIYKIIQKALDSNNLSSCFKNYLVGFVNFNHKFTRYEKHQLFQ